MKYLALFSMIFAMAIALSYDAQANWTAYNDCIYQEGQFIASNVTTFAIGRSNPHPEFGNLLNQRDGKDTGVTVTFSEFKTAGSVNWATDAAQFDKGSDAEKIFGEFVDPTGNISYGDAPGWYVDLTIEGLDPSGLYTFAGSVNRNGNGPDYENRITNWKIMGADSFTYASSKDAHKVDEDMVEFSTGVNNKGYVAKWENIDSGDDGDIVIRTTHGLGSKNGGIADANEYKGYAAGVFMLEYEGPQAVESIGKLSITWGKVKRNREF